MPINKTLMDALVKQAVKKGKGRKAGIAEYFALENSKSAAFKKGLKTASKEGHTVANLKAYNKSKSHKKKRG